MQLQDTKHAELTDRINQLQQSFIELRGQQSVTQVGVDDKFQQLGDAFEV